MGMIVEVFRPASDRDCTLDGISSRFNSLLLVNVEGPFVRCVWSAPAMLVAGNLKGTAKIVPAVKDAAGNWVPRTGTMMGGNFASTSDSRFTRAVESLVGNAFYGAVAVHDRIES